MKTIPYLAILWMLLCCSCNEITTEISGDDYYDGDQLAVIGYLSKYSVVVNVQKTQPVLSDSSNSTTVHAAKVELLKSGSDAVIATLEKFDDYNYVTPGTFIPDTTATYYIRVSAPGFKEVCSEGRRLLSKPSFSNIKVDIEEQNYWVKDTTVYHLFGRPRSIAITYAINTLHEKFDNNTVRILLLYQSKLFESLNANNYTTLSFPHFLYRPGDGVSRILDQPSEITGFRYCYDQILTDQTLVYKDSIWQVIDRIEGVLIQSIVFSSDMLEFFICVDEYLENRTDPFSIMAQKLPSNMSNGIGFFGSVSINEKTINLPTSKDTTIIVY